MKYSVLLVRRIRFTLGFFDSPAMDMDVRSWYFLRMVLTREQRIAKHKHFLNTGWDAYAAFAWEHFLSEGRGMVTVPEEDLLQDDPVSNPPRLAYAAKGSTLLMEISLHFESKELDWLETYDPDERVIIIVVLTDQGTSGYLVGEKTKPSEAFAKQKAHHNAL